MKEIAHVAVNRRLRPLRFGFLVRPNDSGSLLKSIELNTCLWGGRFNPIIPVFKRIPVGWGDDLLERHPEISKQLSGRAKRRLKRSRTPATQVLRGYIDAFEPDYLVEMQPGLAEGTGFPERQVLRPQDILPTKQGLTRDLRVGTSVLPLYQKLYERDFRFVQKKPPEMATAISKEKRMSLFVAACFGLFPSEGELSRFGQAYATAFSPKEVQVNGSNFFTRMLGPLRMGSHGLKAQPRARWQDFTLFLLDATRPQDLIDFWNLRALDWPVIPVPRQWRDASIEPCSREVRARYTPLRGNPNIMNRSTLLLSRSIADEEGLAFARAISTPTEPNHQHQLSLSMQTWYPRIWDRWARENDGVIRPDISAEEEEIECGLEGQNRVTFKSLDPSFVKDYLSPGAGWANVIRIRDYSFASNLGTVLPSDATGLERLLGTVGIGDISVCSEGIVIRCRYRNWTNRWTLPSGLDVFSSWLRQRQLKPELSTAGKLALELIRSTGGLLGLQTIAYPEILKKLNKMAHGDVEFLPEEEANRQTPVRAPFEVHREWWNLLLRIAKNDSEIARNHLASLVAHRVLRIGLRLQCTTCSQSSWHSLESLGERLRCERCLREFSFPASRPPRETDWCYRTQGPFSVGDFAQGGYAVALAIRFLAGTLHAEASWVPSLKVSEDTEFDFGLFWREPRFEPNEPILMLGECKSFNRFEPRDFARARRLAKTFPGAALVFATLRPKLEAKEQTRLAKLVRWGRKRNRYEQLRAPVLVLTQHELMNVFGPPMCWQEAGGKYAEFSEKWTSHDFLNLCDATQQLHIGMESDADWYMKDMERRRQRLISLEARVESASGRLVN